MNQSGKDENKLEVLPDEKHLLLDHNYDGIQELNHPLPSWWNFIFYTSVVFAICYFIYYQIMGGPTLREDFNKEYDKVLAQQAEFKKQNSAFKPDLYAVVANEDGHKKGEEVFVNNCLPCHAEKGKGDIGPNLTDEYWVVAKSTPETIYNVVFNGSEANGMPPWADVLTSDEIYLAVSYVSSLKNTHQKGGKGPQGRKLKNKSIFELDPERLATTDEHGRRIYLFPEDVKGAWKTRRFLLYRLLILVYLVLPWFYINGRPALMINIFKREFTFFGSTLYGVEPVLFFFLLASGIFFVAFITSLFGRVWCGWACPQTVFIQSLFLKIEAFIEGKARERRELELASWTLQKFFKRALKWGIFTIISLHIAHTFMGYFVGPRELFYITLNSPAKNMGLFIATMLGTAIILLDFGWFREQFCIIACPYGRMQSVAMDENSLVVSYDSKRGEPRRGESGIQKSNEGDCINCYNCVKVCPTGIDIRRGTQLECIACTQCIDACDDIMTKLKKPKGLIRYSCENEINGIKRRVITKRALIYVTLALVFISSFFYFLNASTNLNLVFLRDRVPFSVTEIASKKIIINHFTLKLSHQGSQDFKLDFFIKDLDVKDKISVVTPAHPAKIDKPEKKIVIFFKFDPSILNLGTRMVVVEAFDRISQQIVASKEVVLVGPVH